MAETRTNARVKLRVQPPVPPATTRVVGEAADDIAPGTLALRLSLEETEDPEGVPGDVAGLTLPP